MNNKCILCANDLIEGPVKLPDLNFLSVSVKCEKCGSYSYFKGDDFMKGDEEKIQNLSGDEKKALLENAKAKSEKQSKNDSKFATTPYLELD